MWHWNECATYLLWATLIFKRFKIDVVSCYKLLKPCVRISANFYVLIVLTHSAHLNKTLM
jgi:hypothetical protein